LEHRALINRFSFFSGKHPRFVSRSRDPIAFQVSNRVTHVLMTRIFATFLREVQGYDQIQISAIPKKRNTNDRDKLYHIFEPMVS
jgi:hypothetical protein